MSRKKSIDLTNLPEVPEIPENCGGSNAVNNKKFTLKSENNEQLVTMLSNLKEREMLLYENIRALNDDATDINQVADVSISNKNNNIAEDEKECRDYLSPLMNRTQTSIVQLIQIKESLHQLDSLHQILEQLLMVQEQNYQMRKRLKTVKTLSALKEMEIQINSDPEKFIKSSGFFEDGSDFENEAEFEQNMQDLEAMLAASKSASNKRNASKKHRSKSIISEENSMPLKENNRNYPLRRQSAISDFKPKVSKWTKVKAAFKWEKTNTLHLSESKSSDSILSPNNDNYKNFLKVPSTQAACQSCSGDSLISTSSGKVLTATTPEISSTHSSDENEETTKARNFIRPPSLHDDERRSHSLDGELSFGTSSQPLEKSNSKNSKSAWSKVKGIVTNRNSRKSIKSTDSVSRDISPIDIHDVQSDSVSSPNHSSSSPNNFSLGIPDIDLYPMSDENENKRFDDGRLMRSSLKQPKRSSKKSKLIPEIESLPEDEAFESSNRQLPSPLQIKKDLSESDSVEGSNIYNTPNLKRLFYPKNLSVSDPNSPLKTQEFFSENDFSSGADNDYSFSFSEPLSPLKRGSTSSSRSLRQQDEIMKNYHELQRKIKMEFENKQQEWSKIRPLMVQLNNSVPSYLKEEDLSLPSTPKNAIENLMLNEENLSADFKRKLEEWRVKKGQQSVSGSRKQAPDWQLWKTGQMKFENQGLIALPDAKDLPEEFQKKLNEWKQMKAEGRSPPPYNHQTSVQEKLKRQFSKTDKSSSSNESSMKRSKTQSSETCEEELPPQLKSIKSANEIVVQTSDGLMKFKGISRSFTRKLYEWEKAKGIEPESDSSTFAFLHPKYQVQVDEYESNDHENGCMKRALSVDSIKPVPHSSQMSHQPSSLSLNDADNLKEPNEKKASSDIEIYCDGKRKEDSMLEEPEAVIVEVEDEGCDDLTPMMPSLSASSQLQIPVFKFDFAQKDLKSEAEADFSRTFNDVKQLLEELKVNFSSFNDLKSISDGGIKHLNAKLKNLYDLLSQLKQFRKQSAKNELEISVTLSKELFEMLNDYDTCSSIASQNLFLDMSSKLFKIEECLRTIESEKFQVTTSIQDSEDKGFATIFHTPTFICNSVKVDESSSNNVMHLKVSSESEMPELSTEDMRSDEKSSKKVARNASSSSKRKIRLRRMGSRQNSKTESDSDEEYAQIPEAQRKVKRKSSRATKKQLDSDKSFDSFQGEEEVVYVFKIKPGETNEVITKTSENLEAVKHLNESSILISPIENCVELIESSSNDLISQGTYTNPIVKTKRKIFAPIEVNSENNKNNALCISHEIESSSGSEKNDKEKLIQEEEIIKIEVNKTSEEFSHAQTHESGVIEKSDIIKRSDLAPSIRLMIEKYHQNIEQKSTPNSNSSSPLWLSPVLDRRVRKQSAEYQFKIMKSNSFQEINEEDVCEKIENPPPTTSNAVTSIEEPTAVKIDLPPETKSATGCIPKIPKAPPQIQVEADDIVQKRNEAEKPKTPLSERALRIKQAKEAFFRSTALPFKDEQSNWNYRLSQISVGSTDSNSIENMSCSTGMLPTKEPIVKVIYEENKTSSLPRNVSSTANTSEFERDSPKQSKFGLSSIATKLRKVKLKRGSKEVQKMNTVPVLCRQSLNVNLFSDSSSSTNETQNSNQIKKPNDDIVMKSKSLGNF